MRQKGAKDQNPWEHYISAEVGKPVKKREEIGITVTRDPKATLTEGKTT